MAFVLDTSIAVAWAFADERHRVADAALDRLRDEGAIAPRLWWFEVRNALLAGERRGRLIPAETGVFLQGLEGLAIELDGQPDEELLLSVARRYRLTAYDAAYLEVASRRGLLLATLDKALRLAATEAGVGLLGG